MVVFVGLPDGGVRRRGPLHGDNPGYFELVIERVVLDCMVVCPRKRFDERSSFELRDQFAPGQLLVVLKQVPVMIWVVLVGLPDGVVLDVADHFMEILQFTSS